MQLLDFNSRGDKYRNLLQAESKFINDNRNVIYSKAKKIYKNVVHIKTPFFTNISCDFELLEQKLKEYVKDEPKETKYIKDIEITCEVFENISTIVKTLEDKGLKYVEEFTLNDIYIYEK
ncbi:MAG: type III toxin-antitoxin system ToxN/AbiQ family toxin [Clostridium sp.]|nr:type III toxin-antitoxin system ToxN/AbiQ family toxin [Clostridium sp.]